MKSTVKITAAIFLLISLLLCAGCGGGVDTDALWENATYTTDTQLGTGANTVRVQIEAGEKSVTLTVKTDKATLGEAMFEHSLVNDPTFFDTCNGIKADWDADQAYWSFYVDGEVANYGIGDEKSATNNDAEYKIVYTK